jgi:MFS family permease
LAAPGEPTDRRGAAVRALAAKAFLTAFAPLCVLALLQVGLPVLAPALMAAADRKPVDFGWISGAMGLGSVWLYTANAAFNTALGPVRACQAAALIAAVGVGLMLSGQFFLMVPGALLIGFGYAAVTPAGSQILADHTPREKRATLFSIRQAAVPLGGAVAGAAGSWLAVKYGWQVALGVVGITALGLIPALALAPRILNEARPRPRFTVAGLFRVANLGQPFRVIGATPGLSRMALACIGFATVQGTVNAFFVIYLTTALGFSLTFAGALFATMQAVSFLGRVGLGFVADRVGSARPVLKCLALMSALSSLLLIYFSASWPDWQLYAALVFMGMSVATWNGLYLAEIATMVPDDVGEATAGVTLFVFGTYMVMPPLMSVVISLFGFAPAFLLAAAFAVSAFFTLGAAKPAAGPPAA